MSGKHLLEYIYQNECSRILRMLWMLSFGNNASGANSDLARVAHSMSSHTVDCAEVRKLKMVSGGVVVCRLQNFKANQSACRNAGPDLGSRE